MRLCIDCHKPTKESNLVLTHYKSDFVNTRVQMTHICKKCMHKRKSSNPNSNN
jgi:hypothetical protein